MIAERSGTYSYEVSVSIVEVYNENIWDLLQGNKVEIMENSSGQLVYQNLSFKAVKSYEKIEKLLTKASNIR